MLNLFVYICLLWIGAVAGTILASYFNIVFTFRKKDAMEVHLEYQMRYMEAQLEAQGINPDEVKDYVASQKL